MSGPARALREDGALTFSVGVGNVEPAELDEISGDPERTFVVDNFDELSSVVLDQIRAAICTGKHIDFLFVVSANFKTFAFFFAVLSLNFFFGIAWR